MAEVAQVCAAAPGEEPVQEQMAEKSRLEKAKVAVIDVTDKAKASVVEMRDRAVAILRDPQFQTCTIATAGGTITIGAVGGAFGLAVGTVTGSAAGLVPALFTFGLSIPVGGAIGGGMGLCAGATTGSGVGALAGFESYKYRVEIKNGVIYVKSLAEDTVTKTKQKTLALLDCTKTKATEVVTVVRTKADELVQRARTCTEEAAVCAKAKVDEAARFATGTTTGVTCSAAAVGAVIGCVGGGTTGSVAGGAVGLVPALFTFGLSIPVGAAVGMCLGAAAGGTAGAAGGGSIGYGGFTYRKEIGECVEGARVRVHKAVDYVKDRVQSHLVPEAAPMKHAEAGRPECTTPVAGA